MTRVVWAAATALAIAVAFHSEPLESHSTANTTVSFDKEITRIIRKRCISCHSDQNIGMPLTAYEQVRPWTGAIQEEILRRHMPPWRAVAGYGEFANDASLTSREQQFMLAWIEGNGPKSKEKIILNFDRIKTPESERIKGDFDRWQLGKPDVLKALPAATVAPGEGDTMRQVDIDLGLRSERWIRGLEFKPVDRRVVRAATFYVRETGQWIGSWTPWYGSVALPDGVGYRAPAGAHVTAEIYFRAANERVEERGQLGLYFASKDPARTATDLTLSSAPIAGQVTASPGVTRFSASTRLETPSIVLALNPQVPPGVTSFTVNARQPNGVVTPLLLVRDVLPEWPTPYILKTPLRFPAGTQLSVTYHVEGAAGTAPGQINLRVSAVSGVTANGTN